MGSAWHNIPHTGQRPSTYPATPPRGQQQSYHKSSTAFSNKTRTPLRQIAICGLPAAQVWLSTEARSLWQKLDESWSRLELELELPQGAPKQQHTLSPALRPCHQQSSLTIANQIPPLFALGTVTCGLTTSGGGSANSKSVQASGRSPEFCSVYKLGHNPPDSRHPSLSLSHTHRTYILSSTTPSHAQST